MGWTMREKVCIIDSEINEELNVQKKKSVNFQTSHSTTTNVSRSASP